MSRNNQLVRHLLIFIVAVIILFVIFLGWYKLSFRVTDSSPKNNIFPAGSLEIVYFFNQTLAQKSDNSFIVTTDAVPTYKTKIDGKSLHIIFNASPSSNFSIKIQNIVSSKQKTIKEIKKSYEVMLVNDSQLSKYAKNKALSELDKYPEQPPLFSKLPIDVSPIYKIEYGPSKKYPLSANKLAVYISSDNPADTQNALDDIRGLGFDPSDYEFVFQSINSGGQ